MRKKILIGLLLLIPLFVSAKDITKDSYKYNVHQLDNFTGKPSDINILLNKLKGIQYV